MSLLRFHWLRHAPPINPRNICYGANDIAVDLSDLPSFSKQSVRIPFGASWYVSFSNRAYLTASKLAHMHGDNEISLNVELDLTEQSFGSWAGLPAAEIRKRPEYALYRLDPENVSLPGGENLGRLFQRVVPAIYKIIDKKPEGGDIAVVGHGGTIRAAISEATGIPMKQTLKMSIDPLSLSVITYDLDKKAHGKNPWTLESMNLKP
jgi:alpha-ribazole phosphatase